MSESPTGSRGFFDYVKAAFMLPANVMAFTGCALGSLALPDAPGFLALIIGVEALFVGVLASLPKFQLAIDARGREGTPDTTTGTADWQELYDGLPPSARDRFTALRDRCRQMRRLARTVQRGDDPAADVVGSMRTSGLDTLLWAFLRLLRHHAALNQLLAGLDRTDLDARVRAAQADLQRATAAADERLVRSHQERLATTQSRLDYLDRTAGDADFLRVELDRVEEKILALSEMAVNQHDPNVLSAEIDAAASSMQATESTLSTLSLGTSMTASGPAPSILDASISEASGPLARARQAGAGLPRRQL